MPKRKHSDKDKLDRYQRKIRKLEAKAQREKRRLMLTSSSESEKDSDDEQSMKNGGTEDETHNDSVNNEDGANDDGAKPDCVVEPQLDPEILSALGETTPETPSFGPKIHESLAQLWQPILRKGLSKEAKERITKEYLIPENCILLKAPKLNPEILAATSEATRSRDKRVESVQQQLGLGITALNKGLELLLDDGQKRLDAIKSLSDSCRLLCDLHFIETEARKKFVTPGLDKTFLNIIQDVERDEMLFSNKLSEKIKASKAIEKQGLQIKKPAPNTKTPTSSTPQPSTSRSRGSGNWSSPRYPPNKGGRGGAKRNNQGGRNNRSSAASTAQSKATNQNKQRAPTQQP